jgi:hypothetical protein
MRPNAPFLLTRRGLLRGAAGAGLVAPFLGGCGPLVYESGLEVPASIADLVAAIEEATTRKAALRAMGDALATGRSRDEAWLAVIVASCRQLTLKQLGYAAHPFWSFQSAREIAAVGTSSEQTLALLHTLDRFKAYQLELRHESRELPGTLGSLPDAADAPTALADALLAGDADGADVAAVSLYRAGELDALVGALVRGGLQNLGEIGHVQIHAAQLLRGMAGLGWAEVETVVRCLAWGLAHAVTNEYAILDPWSENEARAATLPNGWDAGADDPEGALALLAAVREGDAAEAVADALTVGLGVGSVFAALALRGSELSLAHADLDGVFPAFHTMTGLESAWWLFANARDDTTRRLAVLQAASLVQVNDAEAADRSGGGQQDVRIDQIGAIDGSDASAVLEAAADDRGDAARRLLGLVQSGGMESLVSAQCALALRAADEDHHFKLPVAAWALARAVDPSLAGMCLAGSLGWGNTAKDADWALRDVADEIAGVYSQPRTNA